MPESRFEGGDFPQQTERGLAELFPDARFVAVTEVEGHKDGVENLKRAGFGVVGVIQPGDEATQVVTFKFLDTPQSRIVDILADCEERRLVHIGAHEQALDDIAAGTFDERWSHFYPLVSE